ncbi:YecA family protein [Desulfofundulus thermosubterraneus]|uniref:SEC-C motif-containing protein n=1 Tax=Desulfofundulus thermosubterraneus DSM 16057 TaxID=1121432 RepID=A0A1M6IWI1_9FIRM|nr:SEC-C domain-containing protein [Desulfofundulus thermosubterraneus]SHJ38810.1 SEC-C motif-containing protein [Desulfofundulus thermosubterraneus DSM 16057]
MARFSFYKPDRNEPCLCGSNRKYKKCCLRSVQEETEAIRKTAGEAAKRFPHLVEALGLAAGIRSREVDSPGGETIGRTLAAFLNKIAEQDEEAFQTYLDTLEGQFTELLRRHGHLRHLRFPVSELQKLASAGKEASEDEDFYQDVTRELFTREFGEHIIATLQDILGAGEHTEQDIELIIAMLCLLLEAGDAETVGMAVLRATLQDMNEYREKLAEIEAGPEEEKARAVAELMERFPFIEKDISKNLYEKARPVLLKLAEGEIPLTLPLHTILESLISLNRFIKEIKVPPAHLKYAPENYGTHIDLLKVVNEDVLSKDYPFFMEELARILASKIEEDNLEPSLREGVENLLGVIICPGLTVNELIYRVLYLRVFTRFITEGTFRFQDLEGKEKVINLLELTPEDLNAYAMYLEREGNGEAAARVREAAAALAAAEPGALA